MLFLHETWGEFNHTSALERLLYLYQALHFMNEIDARTTSNHECLHCSICLRCPSHCVLCILSSKAPIATNMVCFCCLLYVLKSSWRNNVVNQLSCHIYHAHHICCVNDNRATATLLYTFQCERNVIQTLWRFRLKDLSIEWDGRGLMLWLFVGPTGVYLLDFFCSGIQFYILLSPYLCFISFYILIYMF